MISVDWEGRNLDHANLEAIRRFAAELPDVPLTHFLNAAYFTKANADSAAAEQIRSVLRPIDEAGLHVHCWRSLVEAARVSFRRGPTFWGARYPLVPIDGDIGHEVELEAYSVDEICAIVRRSRELLTRNGFSIGPWFRAGGWIAGDHVLQALVKEGFTVDSSATDAVWHDEVKRAALPARIKQLWPSVTKESAPFVITTASGTILEMPDTGALADYTTADEIRGYVEAGVARFDDVDLFLHIGFHQETAAEYVDRVITAVQDARRRFGDRLVIERLSDSVNRVRATQATGG